VAPTTAQLLNSPLSSAGGGIKTKPQNFQGAPTIKYKKSETRQPDMGTPYMDYVKQYQSQKSFKAVRQYVGK
jgi:hypothetical protein